VGVLPAVRAGRILGIAVPKDQARPVPANSARGFGGQREHAGPVSQTGVLQLRLIGIDQRFEIGRTGANRVVRDSRKTAVL
jgi:hypothetical protein